MQVVYFRALPGGQGYTAEFGGRLYGCRPSFVDGLGRARPQDDPLWEAYWEGIADKKGRTHYEILYYSVDACLHILRFWMVNHVVDVVLARRQDIYHGPCLTVEQCLNRMDHYSEALEAAEAEGLLPTWGDLEVPLTDINS